jgi:hypothetical protein
MFSDAPVAAFIWLAVLLTGALIAATFYSHRAAGTPAHDTFRVTALTALAAAAWLALTWWLASAGLLQRWERVPPPFMLLMLVALSLAIFIAAGPLGRVVVSTIPLWALIVVQGFRLPLEFAMHAMYERGIMPVQMSYSGRNFDVLTGASALVVAAMMVARRAGPRIAWLWNLAGLGLLLNVMIVAVLSTPLFRMFGDGQLNTWVADPPFVWLPAVMVPAALAGHLLIFRALSRPS